MSKSYKGLTIIELLMSILIVSILGLVAAPTIRGALQGSAIEQTKKDLLRSIQIAKSEAVSRGTNTIICNSADGLSCNGVWENGWIVLVDSNNDGSFTAGEEIVQVHGAVSASININTNLPNTLTYNSRGMCADVDGCSGSLTLCPVSEEDFMGRAVIINWVGMGRYSMDDDEDGIHENDTGKINCQSS